MTTVNSSAVSSSAVTSSLSPVNMTGGKGEVSISDIEMLFQEVMQKMRQTGNKLATAQSINSFNMQKDSVKNKTDAAKETKTATLTTAIASGIGGFLGTTSAIGGGLLSKHSPSGMLNDKKLAGLNSRLDSATLQSDTLKVKTGETGIAEIHAHLDKQWSEHYSAMGDENKVVFQRGLLQLDETSANKLKLSQDINKVRNECVDNFDAFCKGIEEKRGGEKMTPSEQKKANKWLEKKVEQFNNLDNSLKKLHPDTYQSNKMEIGMGMAQALPGVSTAVGGAMASGHTQSASSQQVTAEYIKDSQNIYDRQRGVDADNLRTTLQKFIDNMRSLVDLYGARINAASMK